MNTPQAIPNHKALELSRRLAREVGGILPSATRRYASLTDHDDHFDVDAVMEGRTITAPVARNCMPIREREAMERKAIVKAHQ